MTALLDDGAGAPRTHALVIGVGGYAHLPAGSGRPSRMTLGLRQLSSPSLSALKLADWLQNHLNNPAAPLGSLDVLVSPAPQTPASPVQVERATFANISAAAGRWYACCNRNAENVAIFYFCGHGVMNDRLALLAEDFAENEQMLFDNAVDFELTQRGMAVCKARTHLFIADTCREMRPEARIIASFNPRVILNGPMAPGPDDAPRFYAASPDGRAFGRPGEPSLFMQALLLALDGRASDKERGSERWTVTTGGLVTGTRKALDELTAAPGAPQQSIRFGGEYTGSSLLHLLPAPPLVPVKVSCDPAQASDLARFAMRAGPAEFTREPAAGDWTLAVPAERYDVQATFPTGQFGTSTGALWAKPPDGDETCLRVT